jgi:hypothetical protein
MAAVPAFSIGLTILLALINVLTKTYPPPDDDGGGEEEPPPDPEPEPTAVDPAESVDPNRTRNIIFAQHADMPTTYTVYSGKQTDGVFNSITISPVDITNVKFPASYRNSFYVPNSGDTSGKLYWLGTDGDWSEDNMLECLDFTATEFSYDGNALYGIKVSTGDPVLIPRSSSGSWNEEDRMTITTGENVVFDPLVPNIYYVDYGSNQHAVFWRNTTTWGLFPVGISDSESVYTGGNGKVFIIKLPASAIHAVYWRDASSNFQSSNSVSIGSMTSYVLNKENNIIITTNDTLRTIYWAAEDGSWSADNSRAFSVEELVALKEGNSYYTYGANTLTIYWKNELGNFDNVNKLVLSNAADVDSYGKDTITYYDSTSSSTIRKVIGMQSDGSWSLAGLVTLTNIANFTPSESGKAFTYKSTADTSGYLYWNDGDGYNSTDRMAFIYGTLNFSPTIVDDDPDYGAVDTNVLRSTASGTMNFYTRGNGDSWLSDTSTSYLYSAASTYTPDLSPDARTLVLISGTTIKLLPRANGKFHTFGSLEITGVDLTAPGPQFGISTSDIYIVKTSAEDTYDIYWETSTGWSSTNKLTLTNTSKIYTRADFE